MILGSRIDPSFNAIQTIPICYVTPEQLERTPHISRSRFSGGPDGVPTNDTIREYEESFPEDYADVLGWRFYCVPSRTCRFVWHADAIIFQKNIHYEHIPYWQLLSFEQAVEYLGMAERYYQ